MSETFTLNGQTFTRIQPHIVYSKDYNCGNPTCTNHDRPGEIDLFAIPETSNLSTLTMAQLYYIGSLQPEDANHLEQFASEVEPIHGLLILTIKTGITLNKPAKEIATAVSGLITAATGGQAKGRFVGEDGETQLDPLASTVPLRPTMALLVGSALFSGKSGPPHKDLPPS